MNFASRLGIGAFKQKESQRISKNLYNNIFQNQIFSTAIASKTLHRIRTISLKITENH